ncbi:MULTISPECIES: beta-propeller domain-containing protein [Nonomuraea]|uniref:Beta-propeller domain-containing protein n=1 Tax=Nonomuraea mangrovi TaxID=2316207 RepID=A0ABW4SQI3_9ACTN
MKTLIRTALTAAALATAAAACSSSVAPRTAAPLDLSDVKLVSYSSCDDMLSGLRENTAKNVSSWGLGGPPIMYMERSDVAGKAVPQSTAEGKAADHSTTNVHEQGVDEPDLVKTDGKRVITVSHGKLRVIDAATRKVTGTLELAKENWVAGDLLVSGDRALVLFNGGGIPFGAVAKRAFAPTGGPQYALVDLSGEPRLLGTIEPRGMHVDARLVGSTVRLVVRSQPDITFPQPREDVPEAERIKVNQAVVRQAPISAWLPKFTITDASGRSREESVKCEQVSHPDEYTGTSLLTVHSIDLTRDLGASAADPIAVAADGDTVYGTGTSLYVTSNPRWWFPVPMEPVPVADTPQPPATVSGTTTPVPPASPSDAPSATASAPAASADSSTGSSGSALAPIDEPTPTGSGAPATGPAVPPEETEVHRFDISQAGAPKYVASGKVPGRLLNQYAMSEYEGNLRVATTTADQKTSSSSVYVLRADTLAKVGEVGGLGRNERIYSVRFIGPVGYVVTFRQVDPLYTLDLRDPAAPKVTGELKITGYSAYLHPAGEGRLIGLGQEASEKGRTLGTQVSLFDVSDPANPRRLSQLFQKDSGSEAEWDPHAFLYWPKTGTAVIPVSSYRNGESESGAMVLKITDSGVSEAGTIKHPRVKEENYTYEPNIQRSLVIGDSLWTVSPSGIKVNDLNTLDEQAWIPLA